VRDNYYEPGRANIVVLNWDRRSSVQADVSSVLHGGTATRFWTGRTTAELKSRAGLIRVDPLVIPMVRTTGRNSGRP